VASEIAATRPRTLRQLIQIRAEIVLAELDLVEEEDLSLWDQEIEEGAS